MRTLSSAGALDASSAPITPKIASPPVAAEPARSTIHPLNTTYEFVKMRRRSLKYMRQTPKFKRRTRTRTNPNAKQRTRTRPNQSTSPERESEEWVLREPGFRDRTPTRKERTEADRIWRWWLQEKRSRLYWACAYFLDGTSPQPRLHAGSVVRVGSGRKARAWVGSVAVLGRVGLESRGLGRDPGRPSEKIKLEEKLAKSFGWLIEDSFDVFELDERGRRAGLDDLIAVMLELAAGNPSNSSI
ncbi:hypothetical protein R3P38DRAFT_2801295 [Favolaschia claudopus]|uniref:Uncharacterized protein n=1 Tax=Favolaschia claudopus TaxID=2862362 RepID=A0AAV9ZWE0_9AGAR